MKYIQLFESWSIKNRYTFLLKSEPGLESLFLNEALKLKINRDSNELIVVSDLEGKFASRETFINKNILKENGFRWINGNWTISVDKFENAKKIISLINNAEYLVNSFEELEDMIDNSEIDKKGLLKSKLDSYIDELANATDEKTLSDEIKRYLDFFSKFHSYSFYNRILIFLQRPDATVVASYNKWKEKNRQVKKGAKGISIFVPIFSKGDIGNITTPIDDISGQEIKATDDLRGFKIGNVFDISDTEPINELGEIPETPQWWGDDTPSEIADKLFRYVSEIVSDMGIKITFEDASKGERGFASGDHINISSGVSGVGKISTMIHEIAHELMHFKKSSIFYQEDDIRNIQDVNELRQIQELQAESVSYVVLKHYDLPVSHHATYLALWKANKEKIHKNLEIISKVSQFIIERIDDEAKRDNP